MEEVEWNSFNKKNCPKQSNDENHPPSPEEKIKINMNGIVFNTFKMKPFPWWRQTGWTTRCQ